MAVGRGAEASLTWGDLCWSGAGTYQVPALSLNQFMKILEPRMWVHLQGTCVLSEYLFRKIKAFLYTVENKMCSYFSAPFLHYLYFQRRVRCLFIQHWGTGAYLTQLVLYICSWQCCSSKTEWMVSSSSAAVGNGMGTHQTKSSQFAIIFISYQKKLLHFQNV